MNRVEPRLDADARPTVAFVYDPQAFPVLSLFAATRDVCDLLWVVDLSAQSEKTAKMLRRFGTVVDVGGLSQHAAADAIATNRPAGILTLSDRFLPWTAAVAAHLGLPFHRPEVAATLTDKHLQRSALAAGGLAVPRHWAVAGVADRAGADIAAEAHFPLVLKPRHGAGSKDTWLIRDADDLSTALDEVRAPIGETPRGFVLEEFIPDGFESVGGAGFAGYVSVESVVSKGRISHLAVSGRTPQAWPLRETGLFTPSAVDGPLRDEVLAVAGQAARALDIEIGCLHTEVKLTPDGPVVIEVNGRIGGGVPESLAASTGIALLPMAFELALGKEIAFSSLPATAQIGYTLWVQGPEEYRQLTSIEGLTELRELDGVDDVYVNRAPGQPIDWRDGNNGYVFSVSGAVADHQTLRELTDYLASSVKILGE